MKLDELQALFVNDVVSDEPHNETLLQKIRQDRGISAATRLSVYRSTVRAVHFKVLDETYPVTAKVLGQNYWHQLLSHELRLKHQTTKDLNQFGSMIPALLSELCENRAELKDYPYLGELAALEWLVHQISLSEDEPPFDWQRFMALEPEQQANVKLKRSKSACLFQAKHPVDELWTMHQEGENKSSFDEAPNGIHCCVYREGFVVKMERLSLGQVELLDKLEDTTLAELQSTNNTENDEQIQLLFAMIKQGWISDFEES